MHGDRAGYITIIVALTVTVLGLLGFQYYAAYFAPVPVRLQEGPVRNTGSTTALTAMPATRISDASPSYALDEVPNDGDGRFTHRPSEG